MVPATGPMPGMQMDQIKKVVVIGGGMGGLALGKALLDRNIDVTIYEQASQLTQVGAGIQLTPNAVKVLRGLGLEHRLAEFGFFPDAIQGRDWRSGRSVFCTPLAGVCERIYHAPYIHIHRADLQAILHEALPDRVLQLSSQCIDVADDGRSAIARFADGRVVEADLIVAADGIRSVVRRCLFGDDKPRFTGNICWRSVIPFDDGPEPDLVSPDNSIWFGPNGHIVTYYVRGGRGVNVVACLESEHWQEESWNVRSTKEDLAAAYVGWHPKLQRIFERADEVYKWGLFDRDPMKTWSRGRITLLGDAAHPMLPYLSQGAAMAMEDAMVLARVLEQHRSNTVDVLCSYESLRIPRTARVQLTSREQGKKNHLVSPWARLRRDIGYRLKSFINAQESGLKAGWIYEYDANSAAEDMNLKAAV